MAKIVRFRNRRVKLEDLKDFAGQTLCRIRKKLPEDYEDELIFGEFYVGVNKAEYDDHNAIKVDPKNYSSAFFRIHMNRPQMARKKIDCIEDFFNAISNLNKIHDKKNYAGLFEFITGGRENPGLRFFDDTSPPLMCEKDEVLNAYNNDNVLVTKTLLEFIKKGKIYVSMQFYV